MARAWSSATRSTDPVPPTKHEHRTDATRSEPLLRARHRRAELTKALDLLPADDLRTRKEVKDAVKAVDELLTGDPTRLANLTSIAINRWLEADKHLAERT